MGIPEDVAKSRWCPFARVPGKGGTAANRDPEGHRTYSTACIASDCMAWRWDTAERDGLRVRAIAGYCGLAGRPLSRDEVEYT
jgi:hypothetical protein